MGRKPKILGNKINIIITINEDTYSNLRKIQQTNGYDTVQDLIRAIIYSFIQTNNFNNKQMDGGIIEKIDNKIIENELQQQFYELKKLINIRNKFKRNDLRYFEFNQQFLKKSKEIIKILKQYQNQINEKLKQEIEEFLNKNL